MYPTSPSPPRTTLAPALFHGHEDYDGHSVPASTIIQWYRARSPQRCSGRLAASGYVCALIDMGVPSHLASGASPTLIADVPISGQPGYVAWFLFPRSPPSHSPSSRTPAPVLYPVRHSRCSSSSLSSAFSAYAAVLKLLNDDTAFVPDYGDGGGGGPNRSTSPRSAATLLPALIRVLLGISRALSVCMRGRAASPNLEGFRRRRMMQYGGEGVWRQSIDDVFGA
ncbi:hypothetical protein B0H11DRAFT_2228511 [Mycena galericulata]|nr:hypothetical protein B0H11DRAFT_2228511 [Mycena galericulata]